MVPIEPSKEILRVVEAERHRLKPLNRQEVREEIARALHDYGSRMDVALGRHSLGADKAHDTAKMLKGEIVPVDEDPPAEEAQLKGCPPCAYDAGIGCTHPRKNADWKYPMGDCANRQQPTFPKQRPTRSNACTNYAHGWTTEPEPDVAEGECQHEKLDICRVLKGRCICAKGIRVGCPVEALLKRAVDAEKAAAEPEPVEVTAAWGRSTGEDGCLELHDEEGNLRVRIQPGVVPELEKSGVPGETEPGCCGACAWWCTDIPGRELTLGWGDCQRRSDPRRVFETQWCGDWSRRPTGREKPSDDGSAT